MPQIHLGVYLTSGDETVNSVRWALEVRIKPELLLEEEDPADDAPRLVIERNGGKLCTQKGDMTDASKHRLGADVSQ